MMPIYRLEYHSDAVQDLVDIHNLIEDYAGRAIADRKMAEIEAATYRLESLPKIGSVRDDFAPNLRALPVADKGVICFTVDDETLTVFIICISYAGSDWASRVKERL